MDIRDAALHFEAVKISLSQDKNGLVLKLSLHPDEVPKDVILAPLGTRYMVALVQIGDDEQPVKGRDKSEGDRAVAIAGALCRNPRFVGWLAKKGYASGASSDKAAEGLREILGVSSRSELATNEEARQTFMQLRAEFEDDYKKGKVE